MHLKSKPQQLTIPLTCLQGIIKLHVEGVSGKLQCNYYTYGKIVDIIIATYIYTHNNRAELLEKYQYHALHV